MVCSRNRNHHLLLHQSSWSQIVAEKSTRRKFQSSSFVTNFHLPTFHYSVSLLFVLSTVLRKLVSYLFYPIWGKSLTSLLFAIAKLLASTRWIATVNIALHSTMWSNSYLCFFCNPIQCPLLLDLLYNIIAIIYPSSSWSMIIHMSSLHNRLFLWLKSGDFCQTSIIHDFTKHNVCDMVWLIGWTDDWLYEPLYWHLNVNSNTREQNITKNVVKPKNLNILKYTSRTERYQ